MRLELHHAYVQDVQAKTATRYHHQTLDIDLDGLQRELAAEPRLRQVHIDLVHPGEACRIGRIFDVFAPRAKLNGGTDFPGVLGALQRVGSGTTQALDRVAVIVTDQQLANPSTLAVLDMSGPGADLSPFASMHHVVISAWPEPHVGRQEYLAALRLTGLKTAVHLAQAAGGATPDSVDVFDLPSPTRVPPAYQHLPRVAYGYQIHSHQRPTGAEEGILYGDPIRRMLPTMVHPNEILDGAVLRGFMGRLVTTYAIQNHALIRYLYAQHTHDLWFAGVVLTVAQATEPERVRSASMAATLISDVLGADGAVFTKIGGGAPHVDMAQLAAQCEALGVRTTLIVEDMSTDGSSEGMLLFNTPSLDALVNVGCAHQKITLPAVQRVIGAPDLDATLQGPYETTYGTICGAIEQIGNSQLVALVQ